MRKGIPEFFPTMQALSMLPRRLLTFLADHLIGYGRLRKRAGTSEWN